MFEIISNVNTFFADKISALHFSEHLKAYIVSILSKYKISHYDFSNESLTLLYHSAKINHDFYTYQNLGDWIFFVEVIFPQYLNDTNKKYYHSLAQLSYFDCYKLTNKKIDIYLHLADEFSLLTEKTKLIIHSI